MKTKVYTQVQIENGISVVHLDTNYNIAKINITLGGEISKVFTECKAVAGIGITPEVSMNNPVLYEFFFESVWCDDTSKPMADISLEDWLKKYTLRRYGKESENANKSWEWARSNTSYPSIPTSFDDVVFSL